jgi:hypothetical protein
MWVSWHESFGNWEPDKASLETHDYEVMALPVGSWWPSIWDTNTLRISSLHHWGLLPLCFSYLICCASHIRSAVLLIFDLHLRGGRYYARHNSYFTFFFCSPGWQSARFSLQHAGVRQLGVRYSIYSVYKYSQHPKSKGNFLKFMC